MRAREARAVAGEQPPHDLDRLPHPRHRRAFVEPQPVEPCARGEAEIGAAAGGDVERRGLPGELDRMERRGVERGRPEPHPLGRRRDHEQREDRGLEEEVVVDRDDVEACLLGLLRERRVLLGPLVRLQPEPDLVQVRSSVTSVRSPMRSIRMTTRSSGSGQHDEVVLLEPVLRRQPALLRRDQRQHRLQRVQAEVLPGRDPHAVGLGHLEVVADLEPAHRPALDPLDGDPDVVEAHLGHAQTVLPALARGGRTGQCCATFPGATAKEGLS